MTDNWDDSDDEWDVDDDALDAKLGIKKAEAPAFDDEEDLSLKEKQATDKASQAELKKKGSAMAAKKRDEQDRKEELELAIKAMELEAELEANMSPEERRTLERQRVEDADHALTDDLFGAVDNTKEKSAAISAAQAGDKVVMKDLKDHMKHARKCGECLKVGTNWKEAALAISCAPDTKRYIRMTLKELVDSLTHYISASRLMAKSIWRQSF
jgi:translation initiation factor 3 subunit J